MQHLFLPVRVHSVIIKFNRVHITQGSQFLSSAPVLPVWFEVVTFYQCIVCVPVNRRFPSLAPVNVPFHTTQDSEEVLGEVPLGIHIVLRLPGPVLSMPDKIADHRNVQIQLAGIIVLHYVHATGHNVPDGGTISLMKQDQRVTSPVYRLLKRHVTATRSVETPTERNLTQHRHHGSVHTQ